MVRHTILQQTEPNGRSWINRACCVWFGFCMFRAAHQSDDPFDDAGGPRGRASSGRRADLAGTGVELGRPQFWNWDTRNRKSPTAPCGISREPPHNDRPMISIMTPLKPRLVQVYIARTFHCVQHSRTAEWSAFRSGTASRSFRERQTKALVGWASCPPLFV